MVLSLLEETNSTAGSALPSWATWVIMGALIVLVFVSMFLMNRRSKKREQEAQKLIDAVKPGNKVKTIGGICGIVVEVNPEEDTFVLETGSETSGKCYMKFVRQAILESDAVVESGSASAHGHTEAPAENDVFTETTPAEAPAEPPVQIENGTDTDTEEIK